jgi:hypothetical protein
VSRPTVFESLIIFAAVQDWLPLVVGALTVIGAVIAAYVSSGPARRQAKESIILTKEQGAEKLIQAANEALARENERLYRIMDRKDAQLERHELEIVELERKLEECRKT